MVQVTAPPDLWVRARFFRGLGDLSRLVILETLQRGERTVSEVAEATGMSLSNASRHLTCLDECGLVEARAEWRYVRYRLADGVPELLAMNESFIERVAERIAACRRPEMEDRDGSA